MALPDAVTVTAGQPFRGCYLSRVARAAPPSGEPAMANQKRSHDISFAEAHLGFLKSGYSATSNPLFVWMAINWCRNETPRRSLPDWCVDHLAEVAWRVNGLMEIKPQVETIDGAVVTSVGSIGKWRGRAPLTPKASEMLGALGFTSKGKNAFKEAGSKLRAWRAAVRFAQARRTGRSVGEALVEVMEWLGEQDETNAKNIVRAGKRLGEARSRCDKSRKRSQ